VTAPLWLLFFIPGWIAWVLISIWFLYRVVRGWMNLNDGNCGHARLSRGCDERFRPELHLLQDRRRADPGEARSTRTMNFWSSTTSIPGRRCTC
jgi:hypothetical protein